MNRSEADVVVVGAGPAGMAAAIAARESGAGRVVLVERLPRPGGILPQCIHEGFGVEILEETLTGPEYSKRFEDAVRSSGVELMLDTMVLEMTPKRILTVTSKSGMHQIEAKAVVLAMGCRERTRGALMIPGSRPAGIFTAGTAQHLVNLRGLMPGRKVVVLGSGDIGLIMARRLTLEGAKVQAVVEILPYASGLTRNVCQCLEDFGIPLLLEHTIVDIHGDERLEGVTVARVDGDRRPIKITEKELECDTLLLSVGLIPENELSFGAKVELDPATGGAVVDQHLRTGVRGVFACGNALQVHDLVDWVSLEGERAGKAAAAFAKTGEWMGKTAPVVAGSGIRHVVPQMVSATGEVEFSIRVKKPMENVVITVSQAGKEVWRKRAARLAPPEMERFKAGPLRNNGGPITFEVVPAG